MRCTILVLSLTIIYATASPISDIVPEDSLYSLDDDLSEAQTKIDEMTAEGKSDKDCRKLVTDTRTEITTNVGTCQKLVDALPRGGHCTNLGQDGVKTATQAKTEADNHVTDCHNKVTNAASASVVFGSRTYSSLTVGSCSTFYSSTAYTTAKTTYKSAVTAHTSAKGAAAGAATALKNAIAAAAKEKHDCLCKTRSDHEMAFAKHSAADAANQKTWKWANKLECVLDGKEKCPAVAAPKCKRPRVTSAVMEEQQCVKSKKRNDDCPNGYFQIGTKTKNNDVGGACLGQSFGNTMGECIARCEANKSCVSFMYGKPKQFGHGAGLCEICDKLKPNNNWGINLVFCTKEQGE